MLINIDKIELGIEKGYNAMEVSMAIALLTLIKHKFKSGVILKYNPTKASRMFGLKRDNLIKHVKILFALNLAEWQGKNNDVLAVKSMRKELYIKNKPDKKRTIRINKEEEQLDIEALRQTILAYYTEKKTAKQKYHASALSEIAFRTSGSKYYKVKRKYRKVLLANGDNAVDIKPQDIIVRFSDKWLCEIWGVSNKTANSWKRLLNNNGLMLPFTIIRTHGRAKKKRQKIIREAMGAAVFVSNKGNVVEVVGSMYEFPMKFKKGQKKLKKCEVINYKSAIKKQYGQIKCTL